MVPTPLRLLAFAASLRRESINRRLIRVAVEVARSQGAEVDLADFREFEMPLYDGDLQERSGMPPGALELRRRLEGAQGILLASPEYNYSLPGTLKNAIDWMSRMRPVPLRGKSAFLLAASGGQIGGIRGLWQLRIPLEGLGVFVHPDMYTLPHGREAFREDGSLVDPTRQERLEVLMKGYLSAARALAGAG
ncbi:MAG TPA: NAD(P)H-dependent oxidoreductase [Gemmatimonadales bacterium]|nr:NAD(P)H-dependent oxidoreductase [Gemmatimonadales bacterium]